MAGVAPPAPPYSPPYQYSAYTRPYPGDMGQLYPLSSYPGQFSYELGGIYDNGNGIGKGVGGGYGGIFVPSAASTALPSKAKLIESFVASHIVFTPDYSMHPMEPLSSVTSGAEPGASASVVTTLSTNSETSSSLSRYSAPEPDPFKHATDVSQCVMCRAQITVNTIKCVPITSSLKGTFIYL